MPVCKPSTLLGYFAGKVGSSAVSSHSSAENESEGQPLSKKRKWNSVEDSSVNDLDSGVQSNSPETTHKRAKSRDSAKRKSQKVFAGGKAVSHEQGTSNTNGSPSGKENEAGLCAGGSAETVIHTGEAAAVSDPRSRLSVSRRKHQGGSQAKGQRAHSNRLLCDTPLSPATSPYPAGSAEEATTTTESTQVHTVSKTEQSILKVGTDGKLTVEVSYEDFLRSEGIDFPESCHSDGERVDEEQLPQLTVPKCHKVVDYFKKTLSDRNNTTTPLRTPSAVPSTDGHIVTTADVHFEPSPPHASASSVNKQKCDSDDLQTSHILLSDEECDMDIFEISSEIIEISPFKTADKAAGRKKDVGDASIQFSDSSDTCQKPGVASVDKTKRPELTQSLVQKTTQARLCFTKTGLGMNKLVNSVQESTVTELQSDKECTDSKLTGKHRKATTTARVNQNLDSQEPKRVKKSAKRSATLESGVGKQSGDVVAAPSRRSPRTKHPQPEACKAEKRRKKILRGRYMVAQLQPGCDNRSPIRIRLKR